MTTTRTHSAALAIALRAFHRTGRKARIVNERVIGSGTRWMVIDPEGVTA